MPVVPLLAGLVAVLAIALVALLAAERRARANMPNEAAIAHLRGRLDALRARYAEIESAVSAIAADAGVLPAEGAPLEADPAAQGLVAPAATHARNVSTTAPTRARPPRTPPAQSASLSTTRASAERARPARRPPP